MNKFTARILTVVFSVALTSALLGKEKDEDGEASDEVTIEKMTLVRDAGDSFKEVESFKPSDTLGVLVKLSESKSGTKVKGVWTVVDAGGMKDKQIFEKEVTFTEGALKNAKIKDRVDFTLSHDNPYPAGDYKFDVYLNGELTDTVEFEIK